MEAEEDHGCDFQTNLCGTRARIRACHHPLCPSPPRRRSNAIEGRSLAAHVPPTRRLAHEDGGTRVRLSCRLYPPRISRPGSIEVHRRYSSLLTRRWRREGNFIDSGLGDASTVAKNAIRSVPYGPIPCAS